MAFVFFTDESVTNFPKMVNIIQLKYSFYFSNFQFQDPDEHSLNCDAKTFL